MLPKGSVLFSSRAPIGYVAIASNELCTNQGFKSIIPDEQFVDSTFLYYLLVYNKVLIEGLGSGTTFKEVSGNVMKNVVVKIPCLEIQRQIASVLSSLDDKIEVNRRINDNLEQQAQALFKSWFVDFEPFRDQPFVESELGMIPEGWRVGTIGELCSLVSGFAFQSCTYVDKGLYRLVTIKNVQDGYLNSDGAVCLNEVPSRMPTHCLLKIGDILLSLTGNVGRCCFVNEERLLLNQRVAKIKPNKDSFWGYIYTFFRNEDIKTLLISIARGTAQANLSPVETLKLTTIVPANEAIEKFSKTVNSLYEEFIKNMIESHRLAYLRDTVLPRLMSGEIKVGDVTL
jgi:type I restriction enzyme S subunit